MDTPENTSPKDTGRQEKPRIIRNRDVDKAATILAEEHTLPLPPGKTLSWEQAQEYLNLLTPPMWGHVSAYIYRLRPKIRRQLKNTEAPNYIDFLGEPFTIDYLIARHGGGRYMMQVNDTDAHKELFKCQFEINETQYPPILDYEELELEARENQSYITWLRNQGVLDGKGNVIQGKTQTPNVPPNPSGITAKDMLDILSYVSKMTAEQQTQLRAKIDPEQQALSKSVGDILVEKMRQDDPTKQIQVMSGLLTAFKEIIGTSKPDTSIAAVYDKLIQLQADQRKTDLEYMKLILDRPTQNAVENTNQLAQFREMFNFARDLIESSSRAGGRRSGWDVGYDFAKDVGLPLIQTIGNVITNSMALRRGGVPGATPIAPMPAAFDPYANPAAARAYAGTLPQQPAPPPAPPPQPAATAPPPNPPGATPNNNELMLLFQQYGNLVLNALNNGTPGYEFADNLIGLLGTGTHAMIANHGEADLIATMLVIPEFAMFGEPRIRTFVHEFIHFEQFLSEEPDEAMEPDEIDTSNVYRPPQRPQRHQAHA